MSTYNGWSNYETWLVALWLDNVYESYGHLRVMARRVNKARLSDYIKEYVEDARPDLDGMYADLLTAALLPVNWDEIAEHFKED